MASPFIDKGFYFKTLLILMFDEVFTLFVKMMYKTPFKHKIKINTRYKIIK